MDRDRVAIIIGYTTAGTAVNGALITTVSDPSTMVIVVPEPTVEHFLLFGLVLLAVPNLRKPCLCFVRAEGSIKSGSQPLPDG